MSGTCPSERAITSRRVTTAPASRGAARAEPHQVVLRATCLTPTQRPAAQVITAANTAHPIAGSLNVPATARAPRPRCRSAG